MTNEKKIRGEEEHTITQVEIEGWKKGEKDALKNKLLKTVGAISSDKAIKIVKMFAKLGDIHYVSLKMDINPVDARKILAAFNIKSIEDARQIVDNGIIGDYDRASVDEAADQEARNRIDQADGQRRLDEQVSNLTPKKKSPEELDRETAQRQSEARQKNKADQLRALIADGIDPETNRSSFKINMKDINEFKALIPRGIGQLKMRFGGTNEDIISEIRRLAPKFNTEMLRP